MVASAVPAAAQEDDPAPGPGLTLDPIVVAENSPSGTVVGSLSTQLEVSEYALVAGEGDRHNHR